MSRKHRAVIVCCIVLAVGAGAGLLWSGRSPFGSGPTDVSELRKFSLDQANGSDADIPPRIRQLDGRRLPALGEIWQPLAREGGDAYVEAFELVRLDHSSPWPSFRVQDFVRCSVPPDRKIAYYPNTVQVTGILHVGIQKDNGRITHIFSMDVDSVKPAP